MTAEPAMKGVFFDHPDLVPEDRRRSRACLSVADTVAIEGPLVETVLRGGVYARLAYTGPMPACVGPIAGLWDWLPSSEYQPDDAPIFDGLAQRSELDAAG